MNNNIYNIYSQVYGTNYSNILMSYQTPIDYLTVRLLSKSIKSIWRIDILFIIIDNILNVNLDSYGLNITMLRRIFGNNTLEYMLSGSMLLQTLMGTKFNNSDVDIFVTEPNVHHHLQLKQIITNFFESNGFCPLFLYLRELNTSTPVHNENNSYDCIVLSFVHMGKNQDIFERECPTFTWNQLTNVTSLRRFLRLSDETGFSIVPLTTFYNECSKVQIILRFANGPEIINCFDFTIVQSLYSLSSYHRLEISNEQDIRSRTFAGTKHLFSMLQNTYIDRSTFTRSYSSYWGNAYHRFQKYRSYRNFQYRGAVDVPTQILYENTIALYEDFIESNNQLPN